MKKYIFTIALIALLSGCDKWNDIVGRIKEKSPWVYSEETDKLNNSKIIKAKKDFKNAEGTVQADVEFQCSAGKVLILQIGTYQTKVVDGNHPGASLNFNSTDESEVDFVKTRTGENKIAFPILSDKEFNNIAKISLTGINMTGINGFTSLIKMMTANVEISNQGYKLAADGKEIPKFFKTSDWVIEIPTANGKIVIEIDLANNDIQKVFQACSWAPEFTKAIAPAAAPQASAATQPQSPTKGLVISAYESEDESEEIEDFGKPVVYDYCYDGGGGPDHMIIKGDYQNLTLFVNTEYNNKNELIEDKNPLVFNVQGSVKIKLRDEISGPMSGKILIKQSKDVLFQKDFKSHGCQ